MVTTRPTSTRPQKSIFSLHAERRFKRRQSRAFRALDSGNTIPYAARIAQYNLSDFVHLLHMRQDANNDGRRQLTDQEERCVVKKVLESTSTAGRVSVQDVMDRVQEFVKSSSAHRQQNISFLNGRPSRQYCFNFEDRHSDSLFLARRRNLSREWTCLNAVTLTTFYTQLYRLVSNYDIDSTRLFCVGSEFISPRDEVRGAVKRSFRMVNMWRVGQVFEGEIRVLTAIRADGGFLRPVVIDKGTTGMYRHYSFNESSPLDGYKALDVGQGELGKTAVPHTRDDDDVLSHWASHFVADVKYLTADGNKCLLLFDAINLPFTHKALKVLHEGGIIPMAVPEHCDALVSPLQCGLYAELKQSIGETIVDTLRNMITTKLGTITTKACLRDAFEDAFTPSSILNAFKDCGIYPLDMARMFQRARPYDVNHPDKVTGLTEMADMVSEQSMLTTMDLFLKKTGSGTGDGTDGEAVCPCRTHSTAEINEAFLCAHDIFGCGQDYEFCGCGLFHIPHMCTGSFLFPHGAVPCKCRSCLYD